ncbi:MAG: DsbA family protein [Solirubrobacteraceae bacterium]|nr:DsbA family protein [Solirubrobacteraceae bacterium]
MIPPRAVVYTDPNCPFCFAVEERLAALDLLDRVAWRGVQHAPHLPTPMAPAGPRLAAELAQEGRSLAALAPDVPVTVPTGKPSTAVAITHAAAALRRDPGRGRTFVRSLYAAFWREGRDLSDPAVLADLAERARLPDLTVTADDEAVRDDWQERWESLGLGGVPLIVRDDGQLSYGLTSSEDLDRFLR